ncbi:MAG: NUDIX domain-containing protein [Actinobacteria bacterium]|nr:NUDIX domain-containing protein [Actinomycetota bacterium]
MTPDSHVIEAAGGVVWRTKGNEYPNDVEVAIVHRPQYDDWSIPKGKCARGEPLVECAIREVFEETGYRVRMGRFLGEAHYMKVSAGEERPKVVYYWALRADGGLFTPTQEVDGLRWLAIDDARAMLTRATDKEILGRFAEGPIFTSTVLLVRHASAGSRSDWEEDDRLRPLDSKGWEQAEQLVRLLSRFGVGRIISADFVRCIQTVEPLSEAIGVPIEEEPLTSELGYPGNEATALDFFRSVGTPEGAVVISSQGGVVPDLLERLAKEDDYDLPQDIEAKKGSTWSLSFEGPRLVAAEYFPPPEVGP